MFVHMKKRLLFAFSFLLFIDVINAQPILPGAFQTQEYLPILKNKRVGIFANHTTVINKTHVVDSLQKLGVTISKIFAPEHGFRGKADAGEHVNSYVDSATKIQVVSLYGAKRKPSAKDVEDVDVLVFDIQDVGVRFYTYISSLQEFIEAAIDLNKPLIIFDRPNPNGFYVDGPVLDTAYKSFVGMQPIPVVYGMTIAEYAKMLLGEKWLSKKAVKQTDHQISLGEMLGFEEERSGFYLKIIKCKNYNHHSKYELPVAPSPNLSTMAAIYWYPSTCYFEGTVLSEGRGTDYPFCIFGHPSFKAYNDTAVGLYKFTPTSRFGAKEPKLKDKVCYGWNVYNANNKEVLKAVSNTIQLNYLITAYRLFNNHDSFFIQPKIKTPKNYFFNKLVGNENLMQQLMQGKQESEIKKSWQPALKKFKAIRKKYLLYKDFE